MTHNAGDKKCNYCWHPTTITHNGFTETNRHNEGCPIHPFDSKETRAENLKLWNEGWSFGFADNHIPWHQFDLYSKAFLFGHREGLGEIDALVDAAIEHNNSYEY